MATTVPVPLRDTPNSELFNLRLLDAHPTLQGPVILKATLTEEARNRNLRFGKDNGDDTYNLSAVLGNENGEFKWGASGFEKSARNIQVHGRALVSDLRRYEYSKWNSEQHFNLDQHIGLVLRSDRRFARSQYIVS
jgi:hypothetical protein